MMSLNGKRNPRIQDGLHDSLFQEQWNKTWNHANHAQQVFQLVWGANHHERGWIVQKSPSRHNVVVWIVLTARSILLLQRFQLGIWSLKKQSLRKRNLKMSNQRRKIRQNYKLKVAQCLHSRKKMPQYRSPLPRPSYNVALQTARTNLSTWLVIFKAASCLHHCHPTFTNAERGWDEKRVRNGERATRWDIGVITESSSVHKS
mmetsp:Transcript_30389/g.72871  ORF Transcript_30389/g.72871 Transcript_30389/m.72871 type:complete len:203 (-) Transcript_30389:188-796(-)